VGKDALEKEAKASIPIKELMLHDDHELELEDAAACWSGGIIAIGLGRHS